MEKERSYKIVAFLALFVAVLGLSIGLAAFSETLEIKGKANVKAQSWDVHFESLAKTTNMTAKELTAPQIQTGATIIQEFEAEFVKPGEVAEYEFDIVNAGSFDAKVTGVTVKTPACTGDGANATTDAANVCKNLSVKLTKADGTPIAEEMVLAAGEKFEGCKLTVTFNAATPNTELPKEDVTVEDLAAAIVFSQN